MTARTMEERERELLDQLYKLRREYQDKCQPIFKELTNIGSCKPPAPVILEDGRVMYYVGPLPKWTPEGIDMSAYKTKDKTS